MRLCSRFFLAGALTLLLWSVALAWAEGIHNPSTNSVGNFEGIDSNAASGSACSQATTFLARTSGLSGTETAAYTTMICGMVTDGTWNLLDVLYIFATNTTTTAKLNLISTSFTATYHGTPAESSQFSADHGYTGDGSTVFLDSGYAPSTAGLNYAQNSASAGAYDLTNRTSISTATSFGTFQGGFSHIMAIAPLSTGTLQATFDYNGPGSFPNMPSGTAEGMTSWTITGATTETFFKNASNLSGGTGATTGLSTFSVYILGANGAGSLFTSSPLTPTSDQYSAFFLGGGMTPTQLLAVHSRINAYMTALGINVY